MSGAPSLNEVAGTLRKAALGAGWPPGHATDFGEAAAWLCAHGWDGVALVLEAAGQDRSPPRAEPVDDGWTMAGAGPASCGPPALDLALATGAPVRVTAAGGALVLLGLAGVASAQAGAEITLSGAIAARVCNGSLDGAAALSDTQGPVTIAACPGRDTAAPPRLDRAAPRAADWAAAQQLAGRILVPDSALSRARGAGGGAADVDGN